jgi:selenocysteine-specific elongation factor
MRAIIGTAGHIDHGKTALVRALTGIDTDRLPEEQERGISIELGFAWMELPGGDRVGFVDVPGHERFVRQMLAGAQGFDLLLLVVAADDGVMPQTEEHFEICHLLGVRKALFVITKADLADDARIADVAGEIEILAAGTPFENAPVVAVSAHTGRGLEEARASIVAALANLDRPAESGPFRMPVDRAFVLKGHGVVVTGTAAGGSVAAGDELAVEPAGIAARVREVQVHERRVDRAFAGQRVALNLAGVDRENVTRGDTVVTGGVNAQTDRFDARVEIRPSARKAVKSHTRVRVYVGTREIPGRLVWLEGAGAVEPRASAYAQVILRGSAVAFAGDRFVLRDETASRTIGGGTVVVARARKHRAADRGVAATLRRLENGTPAERLLAFTETLAEIGSPPALAALELGIAADDVRGLVRDDPALVLMGAGAAQLVAAKARLEGFTEQVIAAVGAHHERYTNHPGIELEALRHAAGAELDARLFRMLVDGLVDAGRLARRGSVVALPGHRVSMSDEDEALSERVLASIRRTAAMPPTFKQLEEELGISGRRLIDVVNVLVERGAVVKVAPDMAFAREVVSEIEARLRAYLEREREITAAGFRDLIDASRKYSIPLLDYFDRSGVTVRSGDFRRLRGT